VYIGPYTITNTKFGGRENYYNYTIGKEQNIFFRAINVDYLWPSLYLPQVVDGNTIVENKGNS